MSKKDLTEYTRTASSLRACVDPYNDHFGGGTLVLGSDAEKVLALEFIRTGVYALDFALGGGWPRNRFIHLYGNKSSGKSTLVLFAISQFLRENPKAEAIYVDLERTFDPVYARKLKIPLERLAIIYPDSGEQAMNVLKDLIERPTPKLVAIDSLAMMVPHAELEADAEQAIMGAHARLIGRMLRVLNAKMKTHIYMKGQSELTVLLINQIRMKIGVMFGDPTTTPGGKSTEFVSSVEMHVTSPPSKKVMAKIKRHKQERELKIAQGVAFKIPKNKCGGGQYASGEFVYYVRSTEDYKAFSFDNDKALYKYGQYFGLVEESVGFRKFRNMLARGDVDEEELYEGVIDAIREDENPEDDDEVELFNEEGEEIADLYEEEDDEEEEDDTESSPTPKRKAVSRKKKKSSRKK